jgi:putative ABC transport system permease protein
MTIFGVAFMMPIILNIAMATLKPVLREMFGSEGKLAALSLSGTLGRTSVTVASLMLGIAMMISLAVMIGSFRQTVIVWVNQTLKADLYIAPLVRASSNRGRISQETVEKIKALPTVADVDAFVEIPIEYNGSPTNLGAGDLDVISRRGNLLFLDRRNPQAVFREMQQGNSCVVTESFALRHNVRVGDFIELPAPVGAGTQAEGTGTGGGTATAPAPAIAPAKLRLRVAGVYYDYASDLGYIIIPRTTFAQFFPDYYSTTLAVYGADGQALDAVRQSILQAIEGDVKLNVRSNRELRTEVLRIFDNTFAITYALHAIAILVAILGVMNALFALTYEMRREFAILTYVGASVSQLRKMVLIQAGILGFLGSVAGVSVGLVLSLLLINVINKQSFGWTVQLAIPVDFILQSSALIMLFALLSGILPAQIAVRSISPEAVRYE